MTSTLPPVSIAIPFFNAQETLLDAVRSVFAQTHRAWELLLVDDGSTDCSLELARSIRDPRVKVFSDGHNRRLATRLNEVTRLAAHDFIVRMDADDLMARDRIERQLGVLLADERFDLISAGVVSVSDNWEPLGVRCVVDNHAITGASVLAGRSGIVHAAVLGRKAWFLRNPYEETLRVGQDTDLWIRARGRGDLRARVLPVPLYFYREDGNVTFHKLMTAYRVQRRAILANSAGYPGSQRLQAYGTVAFKSFVTVAMAGAGRLDILRRRRNVNPMTETERAIFADEIAQIRAFVLPIAGGASSHGI